MHVKDLPPYTEITPSKAKLLPDECKPFKVSFFCKEEVNIDTEVKNNKIDKILTKRK